MESRRVLRWSTYAAAVLAITITPTTMLMSTDVSAQADGCYNGVTVLDPHANSCTLPGPVGKIRGSAPDANAIIACRNHPGCLATYVNGP